jgi:hypothetical protein
MVWQIHQKSDKRAYLDCLSAYSFRSRLANLDQDDNINDVTSEVTILLVDRGSNLRGRERASSMSRHRFLDRLPTQRLSESVNNDAVPMAGFVLCAVTEPWQVQLYRQAFEQAQAVVRPSALETRYAPSRN